jgi:uncharacterized protein YndB with AHSA1/START domain
MLANHVADELKVYFEIEINAPPEKVWAKLASSEGMAEWFSKRLEFEFHEGGKFKMDVNYGEEGEFTFFGKVVKIDPLRELAFTWTEHKKGDEPWPVSTLVSFKLYPSAAGTRVTLTHTGFEALGEVAKEEYEGHIVGWERSAALQDLKAAVEKAG